MPASTASSAAEVVRAWSGVSGCCTSEAAASPAGAELLAAAASAAACSSTSRATISAQLASNVHASAPNARGLKSLKHLNVEH